MSAADAIEKKIQAGLYLSQLHIRALFMKPGFDKKHKQSTSERQAIA